MNTIKIVSAVWIISLAAILFLISRSKYLSRDLKIMLWVISIAFSPYTGAIIFLILNTLAKKGKLTTTKAKIV